MTPLNLAEKLNASRQAVFCWEMGTVMPDVENLIAMSDLFGVSLDYMMKTQTWRKEKDSEGSQSDFITRVKQMRPLEIAAMIVLVLFIRLMDSAFAGVLYLLLIPGAMVAAVKTVQYLK